MVKRKRFISISLLSFICLLIVEKHLVSTYLKQNCLISAFDPCDKNHCHKNAVCVPKGKIYKCQCKPGYVAYGYACESKLKSMILIKFVFIYLAYFCFINIVQIVRQQLNYITTLRLTSEIQNILPYISSSYCKIKEIIKKNYQFIL